MARSSLSSSKAIAALACLALGSAPAVAAPGDLMLLGVDRGGGVTPPPGIALVQSGIHQNGATSSTTVAVTLTSAVTSSDALFVTVGWAAASLTVTCADNKSNSYTAVDQATDTSGGNFTWATFWLPNITNGPQTITCTLASSTAFVSVMADEFSGLGAAVLDKHAILAFATPGTGTNAVTSGSVTTTASDFVYGPAVSVTGDGLTFGTGFTGGQSVISTFFSEFLVQTSSGSTAATYTALNAVDHGVVAVLAVTPH